MRGKKGKFIVPGDPVGTIAAQSLGEPGTQMNMRSFHYAGTAEAVPTGLPRVIEVVDARRTPKKPMMDIHVKEKYAKDEKKVRKIANNLEHVTLHKIAGMMEDFDKKVILIRVNPSELKRLGLDMRLIRAKIVEFLGNKAKVEQRENKVRIKFSKKEKIINIRKTMNKLKLLHIKGIPRIEKAMIIKEGEKYFIRTGGSNLAEVIKLPEIEVGTVWTNDIMEVNKVFGIEAARNAIVKELKIIMDSQGLPIDIRWLLLLSDAMCKSGTIQAVGRHGLSGHKAGILARAAFEETMKHLVNASIKAEEDKLSGVTENVIIGQIVPIGTGIVKLKFAPGKDTQKSKK